MSENNPRKPDRKGDSALAAEERQAVRNQSVVSPDDYPDSDGGKPDYGSPLRRGRDRD
ncbi:hypothetical protein [Stakelama marina]|uniref:Uncharacterized protein n=1 Tax=Stakelama marina TaxID=2826939 RepID=A0A8T4IB91_9SPHN|nr:hypothetical protein [Stakelama marina]MBR0551683.1 hypothetical protein [Stakelama marina]